MKVDIITPSFNQGQFIERTLKSVAMQRDSLPSNIELSHIIYDGGSTDNTKQILSSFKHPISWFSEPDHGQAHAVNKGLMQTNGEIIGWLNSDDIYYAGTIKKIIDFFNLHPEIDVVYGMGEHIDIADIPFEIYPTKAWNFKTLQEVCFICQPAVFFRRRILKNSGLLDEKLHYCMDYEFWIRLACSGANFAYLEEILAGSRMYEENKTLSSKIPVHKEINDMLKKHLAHVPLRAILNYAYAVTEDEIVKTKHPTKFAWRLLIVAMRASSTWNNENFKFLYAVIKHWQRAHFFSRFKSWYKK